MEKEEYMTFRKYISQFFVPLSMVIYVLAIVLQLKNLLDSLGPQLVSFTIFVVIIIWCVYVWRTKVPYQFSDDKKYYKYNNKIRFGAIIAVGLSLIPICFVAINFSASIVDFKIENNEDFGVNLEYFNSYRIISEDDYGRDQIVGKGSIGIYSTDNTTDSLYVPAKSTKYFRAKFFKKNKILNYIKNYDAFFELCIRSKSKGIYVRPKTKAHLTRKALKSVILDMVITPI